VGVKFDEHPIGARCDMDVRLDPFIESRHGRQLTALDAAVFDPRK
jgi:hypothetical protein